MSIHYVDHTYKKLLTDNNIASFEQLWALKTPWFEEPNHRRNGWSGVIKFSLQGDQGQPIWIFIKRQENHNCKTILHPNKGVPTFRREFENINKLSQCDIPSLTTLYYDERQIDGKDQAILITLSLEGYQSLEHFCQSSENDQHPQRQKIMQQVGRVTRQLHDANFRHNCLYPKHFFIKYDTDEIDVRIIDLEKLKWLPLASQIRRNDLSRIVRRGQPMTQDDMRIILLSYYTAGNKDLTNSSLAQELNALLAAQDCNIPASPCQ